MSESVSTPRISSPYLDSHVGRNVIIVGKVTQLRGEIAVLDSDGNVTVNLDRDAHLISGNGAQVIGKVNPDLTVKVLTSKDLGPDVDYSLVKSVVEATQQHRSLFVFDN
ncbi:replication factor A protein 3 [Plectosphaerella plurivora]|uniref:Replication factor A protein 3 n=1 Tax=Plectosphaerella plurivora TaxID=936078 RepID=A0A9P8V4D4_9PEZI|nr:replication factor A protein 3 [Plectosphaerella plurivora]